MLDSYTLHIVSGGRGRGIALYIKSFLSKVFETIEYLDYCELQAIKIKFPSFEIIGTYVPPNTGSQSVILKVEAFVKKQNCIILGDFNFHYGKIPHDPIKSYFSIKKFHQHITGPTHYKGNTIDHIYTRGSFEIIQVKRIMSHYSDHFGVGICISSRKSDS